MQLTAGYGESQILTELTFSVPVAGAVCLLGRNGVGKTTTLKSIVGLIRPRSGRVMFDGQDITSRGPHERARLGIGYVPQGRGIFPHLSVFENLLMGFEANPKISPGRAQRDARRDVRAVSGPGRDAQVGQAAC